MKVWIFWFARVKADHVLHPTWKWPKLWRRGCSCTGVATRSACGSALYITLGVSPILPSRSARSLWIHWENSPSPTSYWLAQQGSSLRRNPDPHMPTKKTNEFNLTHNLYFYSVCLFSLKKAFGVTWKHVSISFTRHNPPTVWGDTRL